MSKTAPKPLPELEAFTSRFDYNPITGEFYWNRGKKKGKVAGSIVGGRKVLRIGSQIKVLGSRAAWLMSYGEDPYPFLVDHKDNDPGNDSLDNLRLATHAQNNANKSSTKLKGVRPKGNQFEAYITVSGTYTYLGLFETKEEAVSAYNAAAIKLFGEFANTNSLPKTN